MPRRTIRQLEWISFRRPFLNQRRWSNSRDIGADTVYLAVDLERRPQIYLVPAEINDFIVGKTWLLRVFRYENPTEIKKTGKKLLSGAKTRPDYAPARVDPSHTRLVQKAMNKGTAGPKLFEILPHEKRELIEVDIAAKE